MPQWERARGGNEQRQTEPRAEPCCGMAGFNLWTKLLISRNTAWFLGQFCPCHGKGGDCCAQRREQGAGWPLEQSWEERGMLRMQL